MKICFTLPSSNIKNGIVRMVRNVVNELVHNDLFDITVLVLEKSDAKEVLQSQFDSEVIFLNLDKKNKARYYCELTKKVRKFFAVNCYDCCVISGMEFITFFLLATKRSQIHLIAWEHRNYYACPKFRLEWWGKHLAVSQLDRIVTITKRDYDEYLGKQKGADIEQIYNLCPLPGVSKGYNTQSKKIISVGYLDAIKGFDMLVDVAEIVFSCHSDWTWDIYGDGRERETLHNKIREKNLQDKVFLRGYNSNINDLYEKYSFFVLTSRKEGMGVVMIEAQKNHLPVVAFDVPCGPSDIIVNEENGFLIKPFDIEEMAQKIILLIDSEELRRDFSRKACMRHEELERNFIIKKWTEMLNNTIQLENGDLI